MKLAHGVPQDPVFLVYYIHTQQQVVMPTMSTKKKFVSVTPLSSKAKNRFVNIMGSFHSCEVEQETADKLFLVSLNRQYCFWIQKQGNEHWKLER